jgi:phage-related protein
MAGNRTLKLSILADVDDLKKKLGTADNEVQGFGDKLGKFGKVAGAAFAAAGAAAVAYAGKLAIDGVKSAIEDEAAQLRLATALKNVTGATDDQIGATEDYITKTTLATGVTDDELRPSLQRLVTATKDVAEAQKLQGIALDISAGSGKSLEAVSNALAKAQEGNTAGLVKLGIGLSAAELKTMSMEQITAKLAETFGGQAATQADTFQGKMQRLQVAFDEGKETVGAFILDAITPLVSGLVNNVIPKISEFADELGENLKPVMDDVSVFVTDTLVPAFKQMWTFLNEFIIPTLKTILVPVVTALFKAFQQVANTVKDNEEKLKPLLTLFKAVATFARDVLAPVIGTVLSTALKAVGSILSGLISGFSTLVGLISGVVSGIQNLVNLVRNNPLVKGIGGLIDNVFGGGRASGGPVTAGTTYLVGEKGPELFTPNTSGAIVPNGAMGGNGTTINLTVNGAIDPEGTARTIIDVLNRSTARGTLGAGAFSYA